MQFDWFTLGAEIVNFAILLVLLKRFLYEPILAVADRREQEINARYEEAESKRRTAAETEEKYRRKKAELDEKEDELLSAAREEAQQRKDDLLAAAHDDVDEQKTDWLRGLRREQETFLRELAHQTGTQVTHTAERALRDLADAELEQQVVRVFVERLRNLPEDSRADIRAAASEKVEVRSAFDLPQEARQSIREACADLLPDTAEPAFTRDESLVCGVAVQAGGRRIGWSVDSYVRDLTGRIEERLEAELAPLREADDEQ